MRAVLVLVGLCGSANAGDPPFEVHDPRFEIAAGTGLFRKGLFGEVGYRPIGKWPLLVHGLGLSGRSEDTEVGEPMHDEWLQLRAGIETSACMQLACVFAMADAGLERVTRIAANSSTTIGTRIGPLVAGRIGLELGRFMYVRIAFDVVKARISAFDQSDRGPPDFALHLAIAMRF